MYDVCIKYDNRIIICTIECDFGIYIYLVKLIGYIRI